MSDAEKPMALDLASTAELREQLFAARDALITEGVARNAADTEVKRLRVLLDRARDSINQQDIDRDHPTPFALLDDIDEALK